MTETKGQGVASSWQAVVRLGEDGYFVAESPGLPGCISQGKTIQEATENIREAIIVYIEVLEADGLPVPPEHGDR